LHLSVESLVLREIVPKKNQSQAEGKNMGRKTVFWPGASVFSFLATGHVQ
jgi:hypothetical protein